MTKDELTGKDGLLRQLTSRFYKGLFSAAGIAPSSTDELPCSSVDCEFWQSQNIASVVTTAFRGG